MLKKTKKYVAIALCVFLMATTVVAVNLTTGSISEAATAKTGDAYNDRFLEIYDELHDSSNGYFSQEGIPYHSIETMMCEAPDYGHETSSETWSYYTWLEAMYGKITGSWTSFNKSWDLLEKYAIPTDADQPNLSDYDPNKCASFCPGGANPEDYPVTLNLNAPTGKDPFHAGLKSAYNKDSMYLMHWLYDTDNWYGYGNKGDGTSRNSQINTYQRGEQESCWETIPFPCWETLKWGDPKKGGFGALYIKQDTYAAQWRYSIACDADARAIQSAYWAQKWGGGSAISAQLTRAAKLGDYLRYGMIDKYMKPIAKDTSVTSAAGTGYNAVHYLVSWYAAWGAPTTKQGWAWKEGSSASHQGYQNPLAAYALSTVTAMTPKASGAKADWAKSLERQLELLNWLQSSEGAIAGGCNNSIQDSYLPYEPGISTFYGMAYDWQPVWHDPPSNRWFGFQTWGLQRLAEYYYETGNATAKKILDKWVSWVLPNIKFGEDGKPFQIPSDMSWSGQPDTWNGTSTGNPNLHVTIDTWGQDLGIAGSLANLLVLYAKKANNTEAKNVAKKLLDTLWLYRDDKGIAIEESRGDYDRFFETEVYIPTDWKGTNAQGAQIQNGMKFKDMRPKYEQDPNWSKLQQAYESGEDFKITYHRFWAQVDIAMAYGLFAMCYPNSTPDPSTTVGPTDPTSSTGPTGGNKRDVNEDGAINMADVMLVAEVFNVSSTSSKYIEKRDINNDGAINMADVMMIAEKFNTLVY